MARPSLKDQRKEEILDAFEICVARYGVEGATLDKVAQQADLARALIRHNIGNRGQLLAAFIDRFFARSKKMQAQTVAALPVVGRVPTYVDWLFDQNYANPTFILVSEALIAAAADNPELAKRMRAWIHAFIEDMAKVIAAEYPHASKQDVSVVATGIAGVYFTIDSYSPLGPMRDLRAASKDAALRLLGTLD
jgi:AcrR family transcriptional regulator